MVQLIGDQLGLDVSEQVFLFTAHPLIPEDS